MAAKEVKSELKSARDAIQNKDYQTALKHCKTVLKLDKTNYNAFIFVGVASLELEKPEHAKAAYKKAIDINAENILAWQGLASLYERGKDYENKEDMVEVYEKLISYYKSSDEKKWKDYVIKLADLQKLLKHIDKALEVLMLLTVTGHADNQYSIWCKIISLLQENESTLAPAERIKLLHAYRMVLSGDDIEASDQTRIYFRNYINLLLDQKPDGTVLPKTVIISEAKRMRQLFKNDEFSINVLARMYLEEIQEVCEEEPSIYGELLAINPGSPLGLLGLGKVKLFEKDLSQAKELLQDGIQALLSSSPGWYFLSTVQLSRHEYADGEKSATKGLSAFKEETILGDAALIHFKLSTCRAIACSKQGKDKITSSVEYFNEVLKLRPNAVDVHVELGKTFLRLDDLESAKKCLENCRGVSNDAMSIWLALEGEIYSAEGQYEKAEKSFTQLIELQKDIAENHFNLGKTYWKMEGPWRSEKDKCLNHLLKAAKLDPLSSSIFLYLGHYYKVVGLDMSKAHRCYKKAYELNPSDDEAGEALGDACMSLGLEDEAVRLYKRFTAAAGVGRAKWAWLRLGLYFLKQELYNDSVQCLQNALRVDVKDPNSWECLGEAYMSRGSYTAALASFTKATELDASLLYSRYQIAAVKHLLGVFDEAVILYKAILDEQPDYVPALKGLGETYISYARSAVSKDFNSRAVDYVQDAILVLARAIRCHGSLSCLWKLLGDVCSLVFKIHDCKIRLELPGNLKTFLSLGADYCVGKLDVLALASSSYGQAARYNPRCSGLWHDLGLSYFRMSLVGIANWRSGPNVEQVGQREC